MNRSCLCGSVICSCIYVAVPISIPKFMVLNGLKMDGAFFCLFPCKKLAFVRGYAFYASLSFLCSSVIPSSSF